MDDPDGLASFQIAHAALREQLVRAGKDAPVNDTERRWVREGYRPVRDLETVRDWLASEDKTPPSHETPTAGIGSE